MQFSQPVARLRISLSLACSALVFSGSAAFAQMKQLPMEPIHESGSSVTPALEGWFKNPDGSFSILMGYFNRNSKQELDIPIGPENKIEPGGPDYGQPTHFLPRRQWGVFTIVVPKDFGTEKRLTWTIVANGQTLQVPVGLNPLWEITPNSEIGIGNTPPVLSFDEKGPSVQGPKPIIVNRTAKMGEPFPLTVWVADDAKTLLTPERLARFAATGIKPPPTVVLHWNKYRGPGDVKFATATVVPDKVEGSAIPVKSEFNGKGATTATFSEPGEYILRVVANDHSGDGGGGFECCWTNAMIKVTVTK